MVEYSGWNAASIRGCSSVGRAPALQAGGHGFESHHLHQPASAGGQKRVQTAVIPSEARVAMFSESRALLTLPMKFGGSREAHAAMFSESRALVKLPNEDTRKSLRQKSGKGPRRSRSEYGLIAQQVRARA